MKKLTRTFQRSSLFLSLFLFFLRNCQVERSHSASVLHQSRWERERDDTRRKLIHFSRERSRAHPRFFPEAHVVPSFPLSLSLSLSLYSNSKHAKDPHAAALLEAATGRKPHTLDTWLLSRRANLEAFWRGALLLWSSGDGDDADGGGGRGGGESGEPSASSSSCSLSRRYVDVVLVDGGGGPFDGAEPSPRGGGDGKRPKEKKSSPDGADAAGESSELRPRSRLREESHRSLITEAGGGGLGSGSGGSSRKISGGDDDDGDGDEEGQSRSRITTEEETPPSVSCHSSSDSEGDEGDDDGGDGSPAQLAAWLRAPLLLVVDGGAPPSRGLVALVKGCESMAEELLLRSSLPSAARSASPSPSPAPVAPLTRALAGVVLNRSPSEGAARWLSRSLRAARVRAPAMGALPADAAAAAFLRAFLSRLACLSEATGRPPPAGEGESERVGRRAWRRWRAPACAPAPAHI